MDKKVFLTVSLCAAIFLLWQQFYMKKYAPQGGAPITQQATTQTNVAASAPANTGTISTAPAAPVPQSKSVQLGDEAFNMTVSTLGGKVLNPQTHDYKSYKKEVVQTLISGSKQLELRASSQEWDYISNAVYTIREQGKNAEGKDRLVLAYDDANLSIVRTYVLNPALYSYDHQIQISFKKQQPAYLFVGLSAQKIVPKEFLENERRGIFFNKKGGQDQWNTDSIDDVKEDLGEGNWMGFSSRYFLNALVNLDPNMPPNFQVRGDASSNEVHGWFVYKVGQPSVTIPLKGYFGPKDSEVLKTVGHHLESSVDYGWFSFFAYPMLEGLKWFNKYVNNYGVAIILLTVLIKLLTYPLTVKSMKGMKEMQRIQPQIARLRERYKDDKEALNKEMLQLMRSNGYNPMSGCWPMFIQMPVFIALYNVLFGAIELCGQPFFGWIHDLSLKDPFFVMPILLSLMMFLQQRLTPNTSMDPAQQRMMMIMPLVFGFMMLWLPSGLTLYMLVNSIVSIAQQFWLNKRFGIGGGAVAQASA